jgi:hypothetical protein
MVYPERPREGAKLKYGLHAVSKSHIVKKTQSDSAWRHLNGTTNRQVNVIGQYSLREN